MMSLAELLSKLSDKQKTMSNDPIPEVGLPEAANALVALPDGP